VDKDELLSAVDASIGRRHYPNEDWLLMNRIRTLDSADLFELVLALIQRHRTYEALQIANACLRERSHFEQLLLIGLEGEDPARMKIYLKFILPRLGPRRVVSVLSQTVECCPLAVDFALYYFRQFAQDLAQHIDLQTDSRLSLLETRVSGRTEERT
jgi:hypothetical protein